MRTGASTPNPQLSTPMSSGQTPQQQQQQQQQAGGPHHGSGVNPLLLAATTSHLAPPGHAQPAATLASQLLQHSQQQHLLQQQHQLQPTPSNLHLPNFPNGSGGAAAANAHHLSPPDAAILAHLQKHSSAALNLPTSIRLAKFPEYFSAWREDGPAEAHFLGACLGAKAGFVGDRDNSGRTYMGRGDYNEAGPRGWWGVNGKEGFGY